MCARACVCLHTCMCVYGVFVIFVKKYDVMRSYLFFPPLMIPRVPLPSVLFHFPSFLFPLSPVRYLDLSIEHAKQLGDMQRASHQQGVADGFNRLATAITYVRF